MTRATLTRLSYHDYNPDMLQAMREAIGETQEQVATALDIATETVRRAEAGNAVSYDMIVRYCQHLGVLPERVISPTPRPVPDKRGRPQDPNSKASRRRNARSVPATTP